MELVRLLTQSSGTVQAVYTIQWYCFGCLRNPVVLVWLFMQSSGPHGRLAITCTNLVSAKYSYPQKIKALLTNFLTVLAFNSVQWCWFGCLHNPVELFLLFMQPSGIVFAVNTIKWYCYGC